MLAELGIMLSIMHFSDFSVETHFDPFWANEQEIRIKAKGQSIQGHDQGWDIKSLCPSTIVPVQTELFSCFEHIGRGKVDME